LLNAEVENRHPSTFVGENPVNYMFIDHHSQTTSNNADYDQRLAQAEHGSIPLQSSILRNPWFLKEVAARLQQSEDKVFSDDESFVSIMEVPYSDPSMAEIYKAHMPDSVPLELRITRSKSKSLNIDDLIKGMPCRQTPSLTRNRVPMLLSG
jgi:hypothetical protein